MKQVPLTGEDLEAFLDEVRLGHWATVGPKGRPRVRPVWYLYADRGFWFTTRLESRRTGTDIKAGSDVAVSIADDDRPYRAVVLHGTPEVWSDDRDGWLERIALRYGAEQGRRWLAGVLGQPDRVVLRLIPDTVLAWHFPLDEDRVEAATSFSVDLP